MIKYNLIKHIIYNLYYTYISIDQISLDQISVGVLYVLYIALLSITDAFAIRNIPVETAMKELLDVKVGSVFMVFGFSIFIIFAFYFIIYEYYNYFVNINYFFKSFN